MIIKGTDNILIALIPIGGFFGHPDNTYTVDESHIAKLKAVNIPFEIVNQEETIEKEWDRIKI